MAELKVFWLLSNIYSQQGEESKENLQGDGFTKTMHSLVKCSSKEEKRVPRKSTFHNLPSVIPLRL